MLFNFTTSERQKELATGFFILGLCLMGVGVGEGGLRVLQLMKFGVAHSVEQSKKFYTNEETGLRLPVPNSNHGLIHINSLGFRGPDFSVSKPDRSIRLAFLGSSTTYDPYQQDRQSWPQMTTELLQKANKNCSLDYINAGLPGFSTNHMNTYLEHNIKGLSPNIIVILPGDINHDANDLALKKGVHDTAHRKSSWLTNNSLLWSKIEKNLRIIKLQRAAFIEDEKLTFHPGELTNDFSDRLTMLVKNAKNNADVVVVISVNGHLRNEQSRKEQVNAAKTALFYMPYMSIAGLLKAREEYNLIIKQIAEEEQILFIDMENKIPGNNQHYVDSNHFTAVGSQIMAEQVSKLLLSDKIVLNLLNRCSKEQYN